MNKIKSSKDDGSIYLDALKEWEKTHSEELWAKALPLESDEVSPSLTSDKSISEAEQNTKGINIYRRAKQTRYVKNGMEGLLAIHDDGRLAATINHKELLAGLNYFDSGSYYRINKPTTRDRTIIMNRLFGLEA
jgi:hypothetical protein